ncbi:hypothetical protein GQ54DRAFT_128362 [Martensiomyces pterosporus]|nr:hypothetical protein GQ54DRAFT_128362 [Martensiomyces pterosporus]
MCVLAGCAHSDGLSPTTFCRRVPPIRDTTKKKRMLPTEVSTCYIPALKRQQWPSSKLLFIVRTKDPRQDATGCRSVSGAAATNRGEGSSKPNKGAPCKLPFDDGRNVRTASADKSHVRCILFTCPPLTPTLLHPHSTIFTCIFLAMLTSRPVHNITFYAIIHTCAFSQHHPTSAMALCTHYLSGAASNEEQQPPIQSLLGQGAICMHCAGVCVQLTPLDAVGAGRQSMRKEFEDCCMHKCCWQSDVSTAKIKLDSLCVQPTAPTLEITLHC